MQYVLERDFQLDADMFLANVRSARERGAGAGPSGRPLLESERDSEVLASSCWDHLLSRSFHHSTVVRQTGRTPSLAEQDPMRVRRADSMVVAVFLWCHMDQGFGQ